MTWDEIERLTQQLSQVMVTAHSTMIEGSRVTVLEAMDFLLGDHACALDLARERADARQLPGLSAEIGGACHAQHRPAHQHRPGHRGPHTGRFPPQQRVQRRGQLVSQCA
ncbi:hypothetical protein [Hymenobacter sp. GOD-10R]|uniref:hypothetical protein n=1 Tax=Hymenobacter sp. GOD-10R TaxID=3093922 RepID=UPI002D79F688|nr:hypothetical protein [Hymenobacter sp. GOD-10R]WRQ31389.1 hypothetical protein SD425_27255 [Hymenobacter sp. GOD-10R]